MLSLEEFYRQIYYRQLIIHAFIFPAWLINFARFEIDYSSTDTLLRNIPENIAE